MKLLTVNTGSSSIRLTVLMLEAGVPRVVASHHATHAGATQVEVLREFLQHTSLHAIDAVAHRVVHGGTRLVRPCLIDAEVEAEITRLAPLAPLHNPLALGWLGACREVLGDIIPQVAVFDTAFYAALPDVAATYALPHALCASHGLRRYGFHGLAHQAMWRRWCALRPERKDGERVISLQLGAGCSVTALRDGRPVETSMGFSPLEGLVMATRAGDVDPGLLLFLQRTESLTPEALEKMLNEDSGLLGISGISADMRTLLASREPAARLAVDVYCHRARKYLGAYLAVLGGADAILFGGGVGEHAAEVRARILAGMEWAGIVVDDAANSVAVGAEARISTHDSSVALWVTPVDEAVILAEEAATVLAADGNA
ncbi:MAG: acetate/propionate family kinase [Gammaproteobacteria bacterium]|nr:acetate/propionate family kinase [Gammaproteobacteria bacterium]